MSEEKKPRECLRTWAVYDAEAQDDILTVRKTEYLALEKERDEWKGSFMRADAHRDELKRQLEKLEAKHRYVVDGHKESDGVFNESYQKLESELTQARAEQAVMKAGEKWIRASTYDKLKEELSQARAEIEEKNRYWNDEFKRMHSKLAEKDAEIASLKNARVEIEEIADTQEELLAERDREIERLHAAWGKPNVELFAEITRLRTALERIGDQHWSIEACRQIAREALNNDLNKSSKE